MLDIILMILQYGVYALICLSVVFVFIIYAFGMILMMIELIRTEWAERKGKKKEVKK